MKQKFGVTVILYAALRETAGIEEMEMELASGATLIDVWSALVERFPAVSPMRSSIAWAVNHTYSRIDQKLNEGDVVAVLPPISGGEDVRSIRD